MYVAHGLSQLDFSEPLIELPTSPGLPEYSMSALYKSFWLCIENECEAGFTWSTRI